jgi:hypothetical protein
MGLFIQFTCDRAHPHADGGSDGVACEHSRTATFDHTYETCEDLFECFRKAGWYIVARMGNPDVVLCPAHAAAEPRVDGQAGQASKPAAAARRNVPEGAASDKPYRGG